MRISELDILKFRHLENLNIKIGEKITVIAGQNGTGKSSILGLLGHICKEKSGFKTIANNIFATEYSEIFKFSYPEFDKPKEHNYQVSFNDGTIVPVLSYERIDKNTPKSLRLRVGSSNQGGGKIDFPVIFLGLKRLFPLAQERKINKISTSLTSEELLFYKSAHNSILLMDEEIDSHEIKSSNKHFFAAKTNKYDHLGNSAGQDNIGQLITAIISFQRLHKHLGQNYKGGLLLIDEIDASLFPAAQIKLLEFLFTSSSKLKLQVVFTTHSIEIIETLITSKYKHQSQVCYLYNNGSKVDVAKENNIENIIADLKVEVLKEKIKDSKIDVYVEDYEAEQFLKSVLLPVYKKEIKIINAGLGAEQSLVLSNKNLPAFNRSMIVLDGDKLCSLTKPTPKNVITLPRNDSPEKIMFNYLKGLDQSSTFWDGGLGGYTKQICFKDLKELSDRGKMKNWWNRQITYWGPNGRYLFNYWKSENVSNVQAFNDQFQKALNVLKRKQFQ